mmetsp:Transcript_55147/g.133989  ORF Transcript_55147/g.133989 Transcript_55147/m.133989 type:complete len:399 (-) Transcript_55147:197-1393(-)
MRPPLLPPSLPVHGIIRERPYLTLSCAAAIVATLVCNMTMIPAPQHQHPALLDGGGESALFGIDLDRPQEVEDMLRNPLTSWSLSAFGSPDSGQGNNYDWSRSTEDNYKCDDNVEDEDVNDTNNYYNTNTVQEQKQACGFYGHFQAIRQRLLDHQFHARYSKQRQAVQDSILLSLLPTTVIHDKKTGRECSVPADENWIVFTAGCYGAGKTHTVRKLYESGQFPLDSFVQVDQDEIRRRLPEFPVYAKLFPEKAGEHTRKEAGMMAELLTNYALEKGQNVLVDGSLRDAEWYEQHFQHLRITYPKLRIGIIHVTAPREAVIERVKQRAKVTGRVVPTDALIRSMEEVPKAVKRLSHSVDFFLEVYNPPAIDDSTMPQPKGMESTTIASAFQQRCGAVA